MNISPYSITLFSTRKEFSFWKTNRRQAKLPSAITLMAIQIHRQLLAELGEAGLNKDELNLLQYEPGLDCDADEYDKSDEELTPEDDQDVVMESSSTVHISPPPFPSQQPPAHAPAASIVSQKRNVVPGRTLCLNLQTMMRVLPDHVSTIAC
jgi:hypothetical protein